MSAPLNPNRVSVFAKTNFRGEARSIGIKAQDRLRHMYIIGKSGVGKSTLIDNMVAQDIINGDGMALLDPHGSSAEKALKYVPEERINDVIYFSPDDVNFPIAFNLIEDVHIDKRSKVANGILSMLKKIWPDSFSARMEYITMNTLLLLLENPGSTILSINRCLADKDYLKTLIANVQSPSLRSVWNDEILKYDEKFYREATAPIQNKVGQFISDPIVRNIVGQAKSSFDFSSIMNGQKLFIANLSKGKLDEQNARLLGGMLVTKVYLAAMGRADIPEHEQAKLPPFYLYVDEFQNFASESYADILSEARKYKLGLTMAHQYVAQLPEPVRDAVFGNVGTMVTFLTGNLDAELFEKEFSPIFTKEDFTSLGFAQIYLKLLIDGIASNPFSGQTIAPWPFPEKSFVQEVLQSSRTNYGRDRAALEETIAAWYKPKPNVKDAEHQRYILERRIEIEQKGGQWREKDSGQALPKLSEEEIQNFEKTLSDTLGSVVKFERATPTPQKNVGAMTMKDESSISIPLHLIPKKAVPAAISEVVEKPPYKAVVEQPKKEYKKPDEIQRNFSVKSIQEYKPAVKPQDIKKEPDFKEAVTSAPSPIKEKVNVSSDLKSLLASISNEDVDDTVVFSDVEPSYDVARTVAKQVPPRAALIPPKDEQKHQRMSDILHNTSKDESEISLSDLLSKNIMHSAHPQKTHAREAQSEEKESLTQTLARLGIAKKASDIQKTQDIDKIAQTQVMPTQTTQFVPVGNSQPTVISKPQIPRYVPDDLLKAMLEE